HDPARNLLFGLLALQTGLINQAQLVAAFHAWTQARNRHMAEILPEQRALEAPCVAVVEALVVEQLRRNGSDPQRSLAAIGVGLSTRECLARIGERTLRPASASGSSETLPGSALGTPAYFTESMMTRSSLIRVLKDNRADA